MIDRPFDEQGQRFARSYSQTSPFRDTEQRQKRVLQTALGGSDQMLQNPFEVSPDGQSAERTGGIPQQRAIQRQQAPGLTGYGGNTGVAGPADGPQQGSQSSSPATIASLMPFLRQNYQHTPQDLQRAFQDRPDMFNGAQIIGSKGDKIQFADGKVFDVIQAAGLGGTGWQELWDNDPSAMRSPQGALASSAFGMPVSINPNVSVGSPEGARSYLEQILAVLQGNPALARALSGNL